MLLVPIGACTGKTGSRSDSMQHFEQRVSIRRVDIEVAEFL